MFGVIIYNGVLSTFFIERYNFMSKLSIRKLQMSCIIVFLTIIFSCSNIATPKKITFQADPVINVALGKVETSLTDYFSLEKIKEMMGENENCQIFDYKHDKNDDTLRFLAQIESTIEFDGLNAEDSLKELEALDPISFGYEEDGVTPSVLFSIPEINQAIDIDPISLELTGNIKNSIKDFPSIEFQGLQPGLSQALENQNIPYPIELCDDEFDTVTFGEGTTLEIGFNKITGTSITTARINKISIYKAQDIIGMSVKDFIEGGNSLDILNLSSVNLDSPIATITSESNLIAGTNLSSSLDLSNKTLPKDICLVINVSFEGGNESESVQVTTTKSEFSNVSFKSITGFNTIDPILVDFPSINPIDLAGEVEGLKGATIGSETTDGEIIFSFDNLPSGITPTTKLSLTQTNSEYNSVTYQGLNISDKKVENNKISLAGQNLNTNPIQIIGNLQIESVEADIDFTQKLEVTTNIQINKFDSITLDESIIPQENLIQTYSYPLNEIAENVNKITFNEVGFGLKLCNGLPFIATMNVTSNFLEMNNQTYYFEPNQTELPNESTKITVGTPDSRIEKEVNESTVFDIAINFSLPYSNGVVTIPNVNTGKEYKLFGQADLIIDWYSVNFILPDDYSGSKGSYPEGDENPIDLSSLIDILGEDLTLSGIKSYLYLSSPLLKEGGALSDSAEIQAVIKSNYTKDEILVTDYLVGSDSTTEVLEVVDFPALTPDENSLVVGKLPTPSLEMIELTEALLAGAKNLKLEYDIKLTPKTDSDDLSTGIEIEKTSLGDLSETSEIKLGFFIDLPIILSVKPNEKGYATIDFMSLTNSKNEDSEEETTEETDLFGRELNSENDGLSTVFDFVKNATINLNYTNKTGMILSLVIEDKNSENEKFSKVVKLGKGNGSIDLKIDEIDAQYLQKTNPFYPDKMEIQLPGNKTTNTDYKIMRDALLEITLQGNIQTDINYTIDFENTETEGEN